MAEAAQQEFLALVKSQKLLSIASINADHAPEASSAPFIYHDNAFWIYISHLSTHTENLLKQKQASILVSSDSYVNLFAVTRASLLCKANVINDETESQVLDLMTNELGETMLMLRELPDFYLIKLTPQTGRFIMGFGQAYNIHFPELAFEHIKPNSE